MRHGHTRTSTPPTSGYPHPPVLTGLCAHSAQEPHWQQLERECEEQSNSLLLDKQLAWAQHRCRDLESQLGLAVAARDAAAPAAALAPAADASPAAWAGSSELAAAAAAEQAAAAAAADAALASAREQRDAARSRVRPAACQPNCCLSV